jgi:hypothetical protein
MSAERLQRVINTNILSYFVQPRGGAAHVQRAAGRAAASSTCRRAPRATAAAMCMSTMRPPRARWMC